MHRRAGMWIVGSVAVLAAGRASAWDVDVKPGEGLPMTCQTAAVCFDVKAQKNITHVFVDVDFEGVGERPVFVSVDGTAIPGSALKTSGGPCHEDRPAGGSGEDGDVRSYWFPLTGNQTEAEVCVSVPGVLPKFISVGAKSQGMCSACAVSNGSHGSIDCSDGGDAGGGACVPGSTPAGEDAGGPGSGNGRGRR